MERKAFKRLQQWVTEKKALLIEGARQVGKTYIIREFLKTQSSYVEINLIEDKRALETLKGAKDSKDLLFRLSAIVNIPLIQGETIIFIDEIQEFPEIVTAIKFLVEEGSYKYILSGSLLGVELKDIKSAPVGYMDVMQMYPLDFEEFCIANGVSSRIIERIKDCYDKKVSVEDYIHEKMMALFNLYLIIGGMPAVVKKYLESNNLQLVINEQKAINSLYKKDIAKYDGEKKLYINELYDLLPSELNNQNKRFILKDLNEFARFEHYENSFLWLKEAGVALPTYVANDLKYPLILSKSRNLFKLFHADVGLLSSMYLDDGMQTKILNGECNINYGAIYENVVAEELVSKGFPLFYYKNNKFGELDFVIEIGDRILPIEVKSGKNYKRHNAISNVLDSKELNIDEAYVYCNGNVAVEENASKKRKIYLPMYMLMFLKTKSIITVSIK